MSQTSRRVLLTGAAACACGTLVGCSDRNTPVNSGPAKLAKADVPVGGGVVLKNDPYVVVQPVAGTFKAYSRACTHSGCNVSSVREDGIHCACHGSLFALADGSVVQGPAQTPLPQATVSVDGNTLTINA